MMEYAEKEFQFLSEECQPNHPAEEIHAGPWVTTAGHQDNGKFDESSTLASADVISLDTDELDKVGEYKYVTAEENETRHSHLGDPGTVVYHNEAATETGVYHNEAATDTDFESDSHQYESYPEPGPGLAHCPAVWLEGWERISWEINFSFAKDFASPYWKPRGKVVWQGFDVNAFTILSHLNS